MIADRRREGGDRDDVLAMLLAAEHEDGSPMSDEEIRDELLTALVAGHETTASSLAFAFELLARHPDVQERLAAEADDDRYLDAVINEVLRLRPVLPNAEPRLVKQEVTIGPWTYPEGVVLIASAALVHRACRGRALHHRHHRAAAAPAASHDHDHPGRRRSRPAQPPRPIAC